MSSDPIEVLRRMRDGWAAGQINEDEKAAIDAALASLSAPKPESAEAVIPWVREWKGSGPQRGFHIREATRLHNNRVVAYLGDQVDGDEVDKLIAEHNGKHPNGDPVRPAPPRPEARDREGDRNRFSDPAFNEWLDTGISDAGHTVWDAVGDVQAAWAGWEARQFAGDAVMIAECCGREECGGECGNEWRGMGMYRKPATDAAPQQASAPVGVEGWNPKMPPLIGTLADLKDYEKPAVEAYGRACARAGRDAALAQQPAACDMGALCIGCEPRNADGSCPGQQPAAVDGAMVERGAKAGWWSIPIGCQWQELEPPTRSNWRRIARAVLTAALAGQQQEGES